MLHRQCLSGYNRCGEEILHMVYLGAPSQPKEAHSLEAEHGAGTSCEALSMGIFCFHMLIAMLVLKIFYVYTTKVVQVLSYRTGITLNKNHI